MADIITTSAFLRTLLMKCIGTVMIEWEQWDFPQPSFDRGYFNDRLKRPVPVNTLTRQRLKRLFEMFFLPITVKENFRSHRQLKRQMPLFPLQKNIFISIYPSGKIIIQQTTVPAAPICFPVLMWFWER